MSTSKHISIAMFEAGEKARLQNELTRLQSEVERLRAMVAELESIVDGPIRPYVMRKQAEAIEAHVEHVWTLINNSERKGKQSWYEEAIIDSFSDLAQRLRNQADQPENNNEQEH